MQVMLREVRCPNCGHKLIDNRKVKFTTDRGPSNFFEFRCKCGTRIQIPEEAAIHDED